MKSLLRSFSVVALSGLVAACGTATIQTQVSSLSSVGPQQGVSYVLIPQSKGTFADGLARLQNLEVGQYASYLERGLSARGWRRVAPSERSDILIMFDYGMGGPKDHVVSYSVPTWGQTGGGTATTFGTASSIGGFTSLNATTTYSPNYGITGYSQRQGVVTTYDRSLQLTAFDTGETFSTGRLRPIWQVSTGSTGTGSDLRAVMPYLVMTASRYAGRDSGRAVDVAYKADGKEMKAFLAARSGPSAVSYSSPVPPRQVAVPQPVVRQMDQVGTSLPVASYAPPVRSLVASDAGSQAVIDAAARDGATVHVVSRAIPNP